MCILDLTEGGIRKYVRGGRGVKDGGVRVFKNRTKLNKGKGGQAYLYVRSVFAQSFFG